MQLYVLGPAFGLPSIDAECSAAIALLRAHFPSTNDTWDITPTYSYTETLPYLIDNFVTYSGFNAIASYLSHTSTPQSPLRSADSTALRSFLGSHGPALTNISLYVSAENYRRVTRPAFTTLLPWHINYILPPKRRAAARHQTAHLGISSIDVDDVHEDTSDRPQSLKPASDDAGFEKQAKERASLLLPQKQTLRGLLGKGESGAVFKLHNLAEGFFEPLSEWLGDGEFFLGKDEPGEVDCLAYGYLGLMLRPEMESAWLRELLKSRYRKLVAFVERMEARLGLQTSVQDVMILAKCKTVEDVEGRRKALGLALPWMPPENPSLPETVTTIATELYRQIPHLSSSSTVQPLRPTGKPWYSRHFPTLLLGTLASFALGGYYALRTGLLVWPHGDYQQVFGRKRFADYGHLGAALSGLALLGQQAGAGQERDGQRLQDGVRVQEGFGEVDVVVDEGRRGV